MTKIQTEIIEMIARLPLADRRELMQQVQYAKLLDESFYDRMTPELRARLAEGIGQADRSEGEEASVVLDRLARRLGITSP